VGEPEEKQQEVEGQSQTTRGAHPPHKRGGSQEVPDLPSRLGAATRFLEFAFNRDEVSLPLG
jgi:hypothetical protein